MSFPTPTGGGDYGAYGAFYTAPGLRAVVPDDRGKKLKLAQDAYNGRLTPPLRRKPNAPDDNVVFNGGRIVVDNGVAFLFGRGVTWNLDKEETRSPDETYLDDVWAANGKEQTLHRLAMNGGICGMAFVKIRVERPLPRLLVLDPAKVTVKTADDDYQRVLSYAIRWDGTGPDGKPRAFRQKIVRVPQDPFIEADGTPNPAPDHWSILDQWADPQKLRGDPEDERVWVTAGTEGWPWPFPPVAEGQNLPSPCDYWGLSDLEPDVVHLNDAINRTLSNINRILRLHAHPKTYTTGLSESQQRQIVIDPEGMIHIPSETAKIANLEMQSDLQSSLVYYQRLREALYELSRTPEIASGKVEDLSYLSAMAMQILYGPLIQKTATKRTTYGGLVVEVNRRLLALAGRGDTGVCDLVWPEVLPRDRQVEAQTGLVLEQVGVSTDTVLSKLDFDPAYEKARRQADLVEAAAKAEALAKAGAAGDPPPKPAQPKTSNPSKPTP